MVYIQTTIEISDYAMKEIAQDVLARVRTALSNRDLPTTKEVEAAVLTETLKILIKKLDN